MIFAADFACRLADAATPPRQPFHFLDARRLITLLIRQPHFRHIYAGLFAADAFILPPFAADVASWLFFRQILMPLPLPPAALMPPFSPHVFADDFR